MSFRHPVNLWSNIADQVGRDLRICRISSDVFLCATQFINNIDNLVPINITRHVGALPEQSRYESLSDRPWASTAVVVLMVSINRQTRVRSRSSTLQNDKPVFEKKRKKKVTIVLSIL